MRIGDIALGDCDEARDARFGGEQVVEGVVEAAGSLGVGRAEADRQQTALLVVEHLEVHAWRKIRAANAHLDDRAALAAPTELPQASASVMSEAARLPLSTAEM